MDAHDFLDMHALGPAAFMVWADILGKCLVPMLQLCITGMYSIHICVHMYVFCTYIIICMHICVCMCTYIDLLLKMLGWKGSAF